MQISGFTEAQTALRHPELKQALYDAGAQVMADALITLHGERHRKRRTCEYRVFNRRFFNHYETEIFPTTLQPIMDHYAKVGQADLVELGYRTTMNLTADFAGIDRSNNSLDETEELLELVKTFSLGATLVHHTGNTHAIRNSVDAALARFDQGFLQPSIARRQRIMQAGEALPNDVLSTLLADPEMKLSTGVLQREMAFYLQAGAHSTANSMTHAFHEISQFCKNKGQIGRADLLAQPALLQRCVHESFRLHPASPVAWRRPDSPIELAGHRVSAGEKVVINLHEANRDPNIFGIDADEFNPFRTLPAGVAPWGLTFGTGNHACLGRALDGGLIAADGNKSTSAGQLGIVTLMIQTLLHYKAQTVPGDPPHKDTNTTRNNWGYYPVRLITPDNRALEEENNS